MTGLDPQLGGLTGNGGPTQTHLPAQSSPALDKGNADALDTDQRQSPFARVIDRPIPTPGDGTDIGSVEVPPAPPRNEPGRPVTPSSAPAVCGRRAISLVRADRRGKKVKLTGLVGAALYGKTVTIQTDPKGARASAFTKTATVKASSTGSFTRHGAHRTRPTTPRSATAPRPAHLAGPEAAAVADLEVGEVGQGHDHGHGHGQEVGAGQAQPGQDPPAGVRSLPHGRLRQPDSNGSYTITFKATEIRGVSLYRAEGRVLRKAGSNTYVTQYARAIAIKTASRTALSGRPGP